MCVCTREPAIKKGKYLHHRVQRIELCTKRLQILIFTLIYRCFRPLLSCSDVLSPSNSRNLFPSDLERVILAWDYKNEWRKWSWGGT
ncbi:hypothetical protein Y032_0031g2374 [Ancylostoma ceylanicum]|uniref:Uncharacterized protein n=1 Tax=Ancylostoma ceylanicum TaxID=53326 RepID=A0A016UQT2_9BILA|nr:hypothetical protein Y032_0031g2374 [Ancylostoma ceylanicum]